MAKRDKRIAAMRRNPRTVRPDDLDSALRGLGFAARQESSHRTYIYGDVVLTIPQRKPFLKPVYVILALELIDRLDLVEDEDD